MGIKNILVLTGDHPSRGDHPEAKPVFDLDAVTLLEAIKRLNSGTDLSGKALKGSPDIFSGAVVNPGADPLEPELMKMEKKIKAGASFFQTQAIFDIKIFEDFLKEVKGFNIPIIAGVLILKSADMARYMNKNVPGVVVPDKIIEIMERSVDRERTAVDIAGGLMNDLKGMAQGVHIMPIGWDRCLIPAMDKAGL
jgi:5,10-methylenetetrahydrofolate reductase